MSGEGPDKSDGVQITMIIKFTGMSGPRSDMSKKSLWKSVFEPDMSSSEDLTWVKAKRLNMSKVGVRHVQETSLEPG
jgi:hypothetical protein